jgi:hypothetical protein
MRKHCLFLFILLSSSQLKAEDSLMLNKKFALLIDGGISAVSFNNGTRMQLGAITPSFNFYLNHKYSLKAEYYKFSYFYSNRHNSTQFMGKYGGTDFIETNSWKIAFGKLFNYKCSYINTYFSVNYRKSDIGHNFYWPLENNPNHDLTTAHSPFNSPGIGAGVSLNLLILKHLNFSTDISYSRYFDQRKIYAYEEYGSSTAVDATEKWPEYKPLNNVIAWQVKIGYLFNF